MEDVGRRCSERMNLVRRRLGLVMEGLQERILDLLCRIFALRYMKLGLNNDTIFLSTGNNTALHLAARKGDKSAVEELLNRNISPLTERNIKGDTPLHLAACSGHVDVVRSLIRHAQTLDAGNGGVYEVISKKIMKGNMPLHEAVRNGHYFVALVLVDEASRAQHSDLLASRNKAGESPLSMAIDANHYHIMEKIVKAEPSSLLHRGPNNETPLHRAILRRAGFDTKIFLLEKSPELIYEKDGYGRTPLHYAAASGALETVLHLLKLDASIALLQDHYQATPAHLAAESNRKHILSIVLSRCPHSVELLNKRSQNILHVAAQNGCAEVVRFTLSLPGADDLINEPDEDGNTPLHLAVMNFHSSVVRYIVRTYEVDIRAINNDGKTALDIAQDCKRNMTTKKSLFKVFQLKEDNFKNWSIQMKTFLDSKGVWDVTENGYEVPADESKKDKQALSFIYQAIDENAFEKISHANTARQAWKILEDSYKTADKSLSQERGVETSSDGNDDDKIYENELIIEILKEAYAEKAENLKDISDRKKHIFKGIRKWKSKELSGPLIVMATFIASVTFSAAFAVFGASQNQDPYKGVAAPRMSIVFGPLIIADTIAMTSAMMAAVILILTSIWTDKETIGLLLKSAIFLLCIAFWAMGYAFTMGVFAVTSDWLPVIILVYILCVFGALVSLISILVNPHLHAIVTEFLRNCKK